ncbi:uncharacterized protein BCR38DRAFT_92857 [Pseudomassariella vexata]|uniref:Uncharacterized protein n=1 Tax=Pseudomassariella vexata TaxID=1141098 RepID=A0A1Y2EDZ2_9PEZI|nr:uncharacterized protein BCR38DRAFT_92857 [Pseudomassariella vexata]ORY69798.1 hypothetical protein BCR38DRAFT_92857 [Pseudomassariella vexata]
MTGFDLASPLVGLAVDGLLDPNIRMIQRGKLLNTSRQAVYISALGIGPLVDVDLRCMSIRTHPLQQKRTTGWVLRLLCYISLGRDIWSQVDVLFNQCWEIPWPQLIYMARWQCCDERALLGRTEATVQDRSPMPLRESEHGSKVRVIKDVLKS